MLYRKTSGRNLRSSTSSVLLVCLMAAAVVIGNCLLVFAGDSQKSLAAAVEQRAADTGSVSVAFELLYQGKFEQADELVQHLSTKEQSTIAVKAAEEILDGYRIIDQRRQTQRAEAYQKQIAELEKFAARPPTELVHDFNEPNDVNEISTVMSVIALAGEFADEKQKEELLEKPFVKKFLQQRIDDAARLEAQGKWLDAYINCYSWLQAIYPDNQAYEDYAEKLIDKANIVASFQDSPCETSKERYDGVRRQSFERAIDALQYNYVSIIDYRKMASKAIERCELLAEVISASYSEIVKSSNGVFADNKSQELFPRPDDRKLADWWVELASIRKNINDSQTGITKDGFMDILERVLKLNENSIRLPETILIAQFSEAALAGLDPYTVMIWPRQVEDFEKLMTNEFTGIGIEISKQKGLLTVGSLLPDTPAYYSGLDAGDIIEAADGVPTKDMSLPCAVKKITGPKGTKVTLTVRTPGEEKSRDITITRDKITVPTIRGWQRTEQGSWQYFVDERNKIGYVRITSFSEKTADDLEEVLDSLEAQGLRGLVLDLRFNAGGLLPSAVDISDKFLKQGRIVSTHPRFGINTYERARSAGTHPDYPLVVLINAGSASASEIVAGALQDPMHKRAVLVGERTHGKGSVQTITPYPQGGAQLKYTMAYYHLPSGQRVESREAVKALGREDWGVGPDINIKLTSDELKNMIDVQRDNDVLVKAGHNDGAGAELKKHDAAETLKSDPQMAVAVLVLRAKLIQSTLKL